MPELQDQIASLRIDGIYGEFVPQSALYELLTEDRILQALRQHDHPPESLAEHAKILAKKGRKIFAITVEIQGMSMIGDLLSLSLLDGKLPFAEGDLKKNFERPFITQFLKFQWDYLAPLWGDDYVNHQVLSPQTVLPFVKEQQISEGAFGKIILVTLSSTHQGFIERPPSTVVQIIRKEIRSAWDEFPSIEATDSARDGEILREFKRETRILSLLQLASNPHIIEILGSYIHNGTCSILMPHAKGSLEDFLQGKLGESRRDECYILEQLQGLATGLKDLHHFRLSGHDLELLGCHHDLKPDNILILNKNWLVADFGLSRLASLIQGSKTLYKHCIGDYFAPECMDESLSQQPIGRASDIWSFGCILSEVLTFLELDTKGVEDLRSLRKTKNGRQTDSWFHSHGSLKSEVRHWLSKLSRHHTSSAAGKNLQSLVLDMLKDIPGNRPHIQTVLTRLTTISLMALTWRTIDLFEKITGSRNDLNLQIEFVRLRNWRDGLGLTSESFSMTRLKDEDLLEIYPKASVHLRSLNDSLSTQLMDEHESDASGGFNSDELHLELRVYNDALWAMLPPNLKKTIQANWGHLRLQTYEIEDLELLENGSDLELASLARMRHLLLLMEQNTPQVGEACRLDPDDVFNHRYFGEHTIASLWRSGSEEDGDESILHNVIVEWWPVQNWVSSYDDELFVRMSAIASLPNVPDRPSTFRVLDNEGLFWDKKNFRFGLVYAPPFRFANQKDSKPVSLRTMIQENRSVSGLQQPLLNDRFALVYSLCLCLYEFHSVGWIHHKLSVDNVVFFPQDNQKMTATDTIQDPYIIGFNHSRPFEIGNCSISPDLTQLHDIHQHPDYQTKRSSKSNGKGKISSNKDDPGIRFTKAFDYYSLGVIMLQIGLWYNVEDLIDGEIGEQDPWKRHRELLRLAQRLGVYMGETYRDVTLCCLENLRDEEIKLEKQAMSSEKKPPRQEKWQDEGQNILAIDAIFYKNVIVPLSQCQV